MKLDLEIKKIDLFSPFIVVVVIILYVVLAAVGYHYHIRNLQWASNIVFFYIFLGTIFFIIGVLSPTLITRYSDRIKSAFKPSRTDNDKSVWYKRLNFLLSERLLIILVVAALLMQTLNLYLLGGIPILSGYLKFKATTDLWRISYLIFLPALNLLLAKYPRNWYYALFIVGLGLFAINGYRTSTMAIIISVLITSYYSLKLKTKYIILFMLFTVIIGIAAGYIAVKSLQWQNWTLNPLELIFYRAGFTTMVLDKIALMPGFTGGDLFYQALTGGHPRVTVGRVVLGYQASLTPTTSITSTIFGPSLLDFGVQGMVVQMFLLGLILKLMHNTQKIANGAYTALYAIILTHTMIWVETGPTDSMVWIFYILAITSMIIFWYQLNKR